MDVGQMLDHFDHALIKFGYREINGVADLLAKQGSDLKMNEEIFFDVPNLVCLWTLLIPLLDVLKDLVVFSFV